MKPPNAIALGQALSKFELTWAEVQAATEDDGEGNTVIALAHSSDSTRDASITLSGVVEAELSAGDFLL